ncbi:MAG: ketopantoate reductase family protein [Alphaproteobacteria bacterium]
MRICIHGAGAIGGTMAARLARAGRDVVAVARGAHLEAMRAAGLLFRERPGAAPQRIALRCAASAAEAGPFDLVVCTAKAHDLPAMAEDLAAALAPDGAVAFAVNGVPWWFFHGIGGPHEGAVVEAVDPGGLLARRLGARRAIGAVIHFLAALEAPGIVAQHAAGRLVLGEPDGTMSPRLAAATAALDVPGWTLEATARIRDEVAGKFMGNATSNPLCALLRVPIGRVFRDPVLAAFGERVMVEARAVALAHGARIAQGVDERLALYRDGPLAAFRTSTLLDVDRGRALEIDALLLAVAELGRRAGVATPSIDLAYAMVRAMAEGTGLYPGAPSPAAAQAVAT